MATGHYIQRKTGPNGPELHCAADAARDQSYFLFSTTPEQLEFLRFPLGHLPSKDATRALAAEYGLSVADKPDSQDICFVPNGDYASVIEKLRPGAGEPGEIVARGCGVFSGYYNDPEKTEAAFWEGGWFRTGDLGVLDVEGRVTFRGRLKDMLKVGGENVAALEIEGLLLTHPAVKMAQIVGAPHDRPGEVPAAFIELSEGAHCGEEEIIEFCRDNIASFKVPRIVRFVEQWPSSATKIQKFKLVELLARPQPLSAFNEAADE